MTNPQQIIILNGEKLKGLPAKIQNKTRMPTLTTFIQNSIVSPNHSNQKTNKIHPNWKRSGKIITVCR